MNLVPENSPVLARPSVRRRGARPPPRRVRGALALAAAAVLIAGCETGADGAGGAGARLAEPPLVRAPIAVGGGPAGVAVGEGMVWVANRDAGTVTRVDPRTNRVAGRPVRVGSGPFALAIGRGAVWVAAGDGTLTRIDPRSRAVARASVRVRDPGGLAIGAGFVWVTSSADGTLTRVDPQTGAPAGPPIGVGSQPTDVAVAEDAVWVANSGDGTVSRIDPGVPQGGADSIPVAKEQLLGLTAGAGGVWVAATDSPLADRVEVARIDPEADEPDDDRTPITAGLPTRLAAAGAAVWVTDAGTTIPGPPRAPSVLRIDAESRRVVGRPVRVGTSPAGIAIGAGAVWVTSSSDGTLTRIDPAGP